MTAFRFAGLAVLLTASAAVADEKPVPLGKVSAAAPPSEWKAEKPANRLRSHQFSLPSGDESLAAGQVIVTPEETPKTDKKYPQWKASITPADGKTPEETQKESKFTAGTATVYLLDAAGTWKFKEFPQAKKEENRPEYRVVWAVVVVKDEATHVRLSGPAKVVEKYYPAFEAWLKAAK